MRPIVCCNENPSCNSSSGNGNPPEQPILDWIHLGSFPFLSLPPKTHWIALQSVCPSHRKWVSSPSSPSLLKHTGLHCRVCALHTENGF
eukprot:c14213_g1_i1 orf=640-906(+)